MNRNICGMVRQPDPSSLLARMPRRIGGPRDVCMKPPGHEGAHGEWEHMSDAEHGDYLSGRKQKSDHC